MDIRIYQIDSERDTHRVMFDSFDLMKKYTGKEMPDPSIYENVYEGNVPADGLEDVYSIFNTGSRPCEFRGYTLSVSDVVEVISSTTTEPGCYYCDSFGFKKIEFDTSLTNKRNDLLKVVLLEPGEAARVVEIGPALHDMQHVVRGYIEAVTPFKDRVRLICNEEGKLMDLPPNRPIYGDDGKTVEDVIVGICFICGEKGGEFVSLSEQQLEHYKSMFQTPPEFTRKPNGVWQVKTSLTERISNAESKKSEACATPENTVSDRDNR